MTDTPISPPPSRLDKWKAFIGDLARPFAIYATSGASAVTMVMLGSQLAAKSDDFAAAALYIAACLTGAATIFGAKALEERGKAESAASVARAEATATPKPSTPASGVGEGELPASERIQ